MSKNYYKRLSQRYFDADLTPRQERRLMRFLARTDDPAFDEVKAVASYFLTGRSVHPAEDPVRRVSYHPLAYASTLTAALAVVASAFLIVGHIHKDRSAAQLASMEDTLTSIFSSGTDVETELSDLLTLK